MANWFDNWWSAFVGVVAATWSDIPPGQLFQDVSVERRDWNVLLDTGEMSVPWVVVVVDIEPTSDWGCGVKYLMSPTIYYITSLKAAAAQGKTASTWITSKLVDLQTALYASQALGTVLDGITFDINAGNPINMSFLDAKIDFQAGSLSCQSVWVAQ